MKEMVYIINNGSCPTCGNKQFIVAEHQTMLYLTDGNGEAINSKELNYKAIGKCCNCGKEFEMMPTSYGFIPLTRLRKILFEYTPHCIHEEELEDVENPMYRGDI